MLLSANNLYTGNTTVSAGLLQLAGPIVSGTTNVSGGSLQLQATNALPASSILNLTGSTTVDLAGTTSQTISFLNLGSDNNPASTSIQNIGAGQTLSVVSSAATTIMNVSYLANLNPVSMSISGPGTLAISDTTTNASFQMKSGGNAGIATTLNMSGLGTFTANIYEFDVGVNPPGRRQRRKERVDIGGQQRDHRPEPLRRLRRELPRRHLRDFESRRVQRL